MSKKKQQALSPISSEKPLYRYWQAMYLSFYSPRVFIDVVKRWHGLGWLYLLLVVTLFSIPLSTHIGMGAQHFFVSKVVQNIKIMPQFMIQNGEVIFDKPMPFEIKNTQGQVIGIIDTTGKTQSLDNEQYPDLIYVIAKHELLYRTPSLHTLNNEEEGTPSGPIFSKKIEPSTNEVFSGKEFIRDVPVEKIRLIILLSTYPIVISLLFSLLAGFFLLLGLVGRFVAKLSFRVSLTFLQSCRLVTVSATPALLFLFVFLTMNWLFSLSGTVFVALNAFYFCLGVIAYRREIRQLARRT